MFESVLFSGPPFMIVQEEREVGPPMSEVARLWISFFILYQEMWQSVDVQMVEVEVLTGSSMEVQAAEEL